MQAAAILIASAVQPHACQTSCTVELQVFVPYVLLLLVA